jgi:ubiquitin carboxyl-terminal hydrolase 8
MQGRSPFTFYNIINLFKYGVGIFEDMGDRDFSGYAGRGLTGLGNLGNSCYLNSCLQVLSHTYELSELFDGSLRERKLTKTPDSLLVTEWNKLRHLMWRDNHTIAPWGFVKAVQHVARIKGRDLFTGRAQNDAQEFFLFLVDCFHTAFAREVHMTVSGDATTPTDELAVTCYNMMKNMYMADYSEMLGVFYGTHVSEITASGSDRCLGRTPEPFSVISLPIPPGRLDLSIQDCFAAYCAKEALVGENAWLNEDTNCREDAFRQITFWSLPAVMIVDLKRWQNNGRKLKALVRVPLTGLDLSAHVRGYDASAHVYDLYATCNHMGGAMGGHYTAHVRNASGQWYVFNDTRVDPVDPDKVVSPDTYCMFFRRAEPRLEK